MTDRDTLVFIMGIVAGSALTTMCLLIALWALRREMKARGASDDKG